MEQDLNVYYDISSSKWWFFDQDSGAWIEQTEGRVEEFMENEREEEQAEKREYANGFMQPDSDAEKQDGRDYVETKENGFKYKTQEEGNSNQCNTYDTQSDSDFSYEKVLKNKGPLRKIAKEADKDYSEFQKNTGGQRSDFISNDPNYTTGTSDAQYNNNNNLYQVPLENGQGDEKEWRGADEAGQRQPEIEVDQHVQSNTEEPPEAEVQAQANDSLYYETVGGVGEGSSENYYGTEYDPNAYYSNADFYNGETQDKYYSLYYGTNANNEYHTGYAEEYAQGYVENYDTEYANNYHNGEEDNVQGGVEGTAYVGEYEAKSTELYNTTEDKNYIKECDTYYTVPSEKEENTPSEYTKDDSLTNENPNKEVFVPERDTGQVQMERESNAYMLDSYKEQDNNRNLETKDEGYEMNSASNITGSSNNVDDKINSLLNFSSKSNQQPLSSARLLDKLISRSRSFSIVGNGSKENNSENDLVSDGEKMKGAQNKETVTYPDTDENANTEMKKKYKGQVHFSMGSTNEQENKNAIKESCSPDEQDTNKKNQDDEDIDAISVPFVRRATRKLTFKDQGGLSGCIKVFLQKKNELIAESGTKGEDASTGEIDIKMANLKRRARELAKRYKSRSTSGNDEDKQEDAGAAEGKGDRFLKLVLEVQKKNQEMKEANQAL